jgi:hypothetical protein
MPAKRTWTDDDLIEAVALSTSRAQVQLLCSGSKKGTQLRDRLIASRLKEAKCEECSLTTWRDKPAPLQVEHIDGDYLNNEITNLKILYANCHMQTETWGFKGTRRGPGRTLVA